MARHSILHQLAADHPAAPGHFPDNPVIPGAVLLDVVIAAISAVRAGERCLEVASTKFLRAVRPGALLAVSWEDGADGMVRFDAGVAGIPALHGALRFGR